MTNLGVNKPEIFKRTCINKIRYSELTFNPTNLLRANELYLIDFAINGETC
jgi:hypothetical protein